MPAAMGLANVVVAPAALMACGLPDTMHEQSHAFSGRSANCAVASADGGSDPLMVGQHRVPARIR